jgi:hypothetical protein
MTAACFADQWQRLIKDKKGKSRIESIGPGFLFGKFEITQFHQSTMGGK